MQLPDQDPVEHRPLSRAVADWVAARVISGELPPGTRLQETQVAAGAGVSRSPVREALRILEREGIVEVRPRLGAHVAPIDRDGAVAVYECRQLIEPPCMRIVAERLQPSDVDALRAIRREIEAAVTAGDSARFLSRAVEYGRSALAHCPNPVLRELVELTWTRSLRYWSLLMRLPGYPSPWLERHGRLHDALVRRDGAAAEEATRQMLAEAFADILESLQAPDTR